VYKIHHLETVIDRLHVKIKKEEESGYKMKLHLNQS